MRFFFLLAGAALAERLVRDGKPARRLSIGDMLYNVIGGVVETGANVVANVDPAKIINGISASMPAVLNAGKNVVDKVASGDLPLPETAAANYIHNVAKKVSGVPTDAAKNASSLGPVKNTDKPEVTETHITDTTTESPLVPKIPTIAPVPTADDTSNMTVVIPTRGPVVRPVNDTSTTLNPNEVVTTTLSPATVVVIPTRPVNTTPVPSDQNITTLSGSTPAGSNSTVPVTVPPSVSTTAQPDSQVTIPPSGSTTARPDGQVTISGNTTFPAAVSTTVPPFVSSTARPDGQVTISGNTTFPAAVSTTARPDGQVTVSGNTTFPATVSTTARPDGQVTISGNTTFPAAVSTTVPPFVSSTAQPDSQVTVSGNTTLPVAVSTTAPPSVSSVARQGSQVTIPAAVTTDADSTPVPAIAKPTVVVPTRGFTEAPSVVIIPTRSPVTTRTPSDVPVVVVPTRSPAVSYQSDNVTYVSELDEDEVFETSYLEKELGGAIRRLKAAEKTVDTEKTKQEEEEVHDPTLDRFADVPLAQRGTGNATPSKSNSTVNKRDAAKAAREEAAAARAAARAERLAARGMSKADEVNRTSEDGFGEAPTPAELEILYEAKNSASVWDGNSNATSVIISNVTDAEDEEADAEEEEVAGGTNIPESTDLSDIEKTEEKSDMNVTVIDDKDMNKTTVERITESKIDGENNTETKTESDES